MSRRTNVRAIVWRDGKILAVKHLNSDGSERDYWAIPGGGVDIGEGLVDAMVRELQEELGVTAEVGKLLCIQQYATEREGFDEEIELFFSVNDNDAFDRINLGDTSHGLAEIARAEFIDPTTEYIMPAFLGTIDLGSYVNGNREVYIWNGYANNK